MSCSLGQVSRCLELALQALQVPPVNHLARILCCAASLCCSLLHHCIAASLCDCVAASLCRCIAVSVCHCVSLCVTVQPPSPLDESKFGPSLRLTALGSGLDATVPLSQSARKGHRKRCLGLQSFETQFGNSRKLGPQLAQASCAFHI